MCNFIKLILVSGIVSSVTYGHPITFANGGRQVVEWEPAADVWSIESAPRSIKPHLQPKNTTGHCNPMLRRNDEAALARLKIIRDNATSRMLRTLNLRQVANEIETNLVSKLSCTGCKAGVGLLQHYIQAGMSEEEIINTVSMYCVTLQIQSPAVCEGITKLFGPEVIYVLQRLQIGPDEICSFIMGEACDDISNPYHEWEVTFPPVQKPEPLEVALPKEKSPFFKVLHLSDTHYDPHYVEGSNANCNEPLCCRLSNGRPSSPNDAAGKWGDYRKCDTPKRTVENLLQHIADTHPDIDYILLTGDLPPHDVWNQTKGYNLQVIKDTVKLMSEMLPGIPIFPALGNHESSPANSFPTPYMNQEDASISWLYDELDVLWRRWLPASVSHTIRRGAFYSVLLRPGFRIISLNMNYCNNLNWWLLLNSTDPATELQWLIYELQSAEISNEKVHIIGHIPPGYPDCVKVWSRNFYKIIARYENTVTAQFYGHTHWDELEIFYDPNDLGHYAESSQSVDSQLKPAKNSRLNSLLSTNGTESSCGRCGIPLNSRFFLYIFKQLLAVVIENEYGARCDCSTCAYESAGPGPTSIAYIGPSVTPYYDMNPGYRIYYIDGDHDATTRMVIDHESWIMNLEEANLYDYPNWYKLYSVRAAYAMKGLRPTDWNSFINEMANNPKLFDLYYKLGPICSGPKCRILLPKHYWKNSHLRPPCDPECTKRILCDAKSGRSHDRKNICADVDAKVDESSTKPGKSV